MRLKYLLLIASLVASCSNKNIDISSLNIVTPTGAPAIAFYSEAKNPNFETNSTPSNIVAMLTKNGNKDIVVIDTVSGIKAIQKGSSFKLAANITFGNFFIAATGNDEDQTLNDNDKIVIFGQNQTPDYIFHYLYGNQYDSQIEWVGNVQDAATVLASGKNIQTGNSIDYVFVAQPVLYKILNNKNAKTYGKAYEYLNVQEAYREKTNGLEMIQASVFVSTDSDSTAARKFLKKLEQNIKAGIGDPTLIKNALDSIPSEESTSLFGVDSNTAYEVMKNNDLGLGFTNAFANKNSIDNFIKLFNMEETNEEIYYK